MISKRKDKNFLNWQRNTFQKVLECNFQKYFHFSREAMIPDGIKHMDFGLNFCLCKIEYTSETTVWII